MLQQFEKQCKSNRWVTSVGNAVTVVTNANLTGGVTSAGNATTVVTNANLTGINIGR
jgi:hypothetical protein